MKLVNTSINITYLNDDIFDYAFIKCRYQDCTFEVMVTNYDCYIAITNRMNGALHNDHGFASYHLHDDNSISNGVYYLLIVDGDSKNCTQEEWETWRDSDTPNPFDDMLIKLIQYVKLDKVPNL